MVRLDEDVKNLLAKAAGLRRISVSDYVRSVMLAQARHDLSSAEKLQIPMTSSEQIAFWEALQRPVKLTKAQKNLAAIMSGKK